MSSRLIITCSMYLSYSVTFWEYRKGSRANYNWESVGIKYIKCYLPRKICLRHNTVLITWYKFASLCITRLLFSTITLSTKFVVAPKSTKALVCTFLLYTQIVTGILKEVVLLCAILLQVSSTTSDFCELIGGILSSDCRSQMLYSTVPRENPIWKFFFPSHLEEQNLLGNHSKAITPQAR